MLRINHAILHVFDFTSCVNVFSQGELDLESRLIKGYVSKHVKKAFGNIDNKRGEFAPDSMFASELQAYFAGQHN
ncbi:MAG: nucleoid-associated protein, partial [Eggerthellaceae bacterium]|nr:nucleoid-associated protein [Eggerthellaceae bacterium]